MRRKRPHHSIRTSLSVLAFLILIFNIIGFYRGFLQIRLTGSHGKPEQHSDATWRMADPSKPNRLRIPPDRTPSSTSTSSTSTTRLLLRDPDHHPASLNTIPIRRTTLRRHLATTSLPPPRRPGLKDPNSPCVLTSGRAPNDGQWFDFSFTFLRLYAYSAFLDDRSTTGGRAPSIRIIAIASELENDTISRGVNRLECLFHFDKGLDHQGSRLRGTKLVPVETKARPIGFGWDLNGVGLKEYIFTCPCGSGCVGSSIPSGVTIVSSKDRSSSPTSCVPIEVPVKPRIKDDIAICIQASYGTLDPHRLIEWLEFQRILGVKRVGVYDLSIDPGLGLTVLEHYDREGFIELRRINELPLPGQEQYLLHGSPVINDCMYRYMHAYKWVLVIDFDEVLVPRAGGNLIQMMHHLENTTAGKSPPPLNFLFLNQYYFLDSQPDLDIPPEYTMLRYRKSAPPSPQGVAMKSYVDPMRCAQMHNHYCMGLVDGLSETNIFEFVEPEIGTNNHYKTCHMTPVECRGMMRQTTQDDVMLKYARELMDRAEKKAREILT